MSRNSAKSAYYAKIRKSLLKYDISFSTFKSNPASLFLRDAKFRSYVYTKFEPRETITWYTQDYRFSDNIPESFYNQIKSENNDWYDLLVADNTDSTEEDSISEQNNSSNSNQSASKKFKPNQGEKRSNTDDTDLPNKKKQSDVEAGVSNVATPIGATNSDQKQSNPTGQGEVDQSKDQQLPTTSGNEHNTRGTLQGEAGNLKVQKPLERYGIVKVNMSSYNRNCNNNRVFVFISNDKTLCNDLVEIMEETYESGEIFTHTITDMPDNLNDNIKTYKYIIGWKLPFNISYPTISLKIGNRYNSVLTFTKQICTDEYDNDELNKILEHSVIVKFKNDVQILRVSEAVAKAQADSDKYNKPEIKKRKYNKFE